MKKVCPHKLANCNEDLQYYSLTSMPQAYGFLTDRPMLPLAALYTLPKMNSISEEHVSAIISKVASVCNLTEWQYTNEKFQSIAQNYFGVLFPVLLSGTTNGKHVNIPIVLKFAPTDERYRVSGAVTAMFLREIFVYSKILEKYREQQWSMPLPQYTVPRCYYTSKEYCREVIVMQDMCSEGYKPYTESMFLDLNHITVSLKSLAKFHALSFIMREFDKKLYEEVVQVCIPLTEKTNKRYIDIMTDRLIKAIKVFEHTKYVPLLESLKERCIQFIEAATNSVEELCICHGDIWKENILYKYEGTEPVSACLIDYQTTRMCSPAFDVLYLITSSTQSELKHEHYYQLLDTYYKMFEQTLKSAGFESQKLYSRKAFDNDLKVVAPACFIVTNTAMWLSSGLQQEGHVRSKHVLKTDEELSAAANRFREIIESIIVDYLSYGFLSECR